MNNSIIRLEGQQHVLFVEIINGSARPLVTLSRWPIYCKMCISVPPLGERERERVGDG